MFIQIAGNKLYCAVLNPLLSFSLYYIDYYYIDYLLSSASPFALQYNRKSKE
jgi:hypothetical protein